MPDATIAAVLIVKNEEFFLRRLLPRLKKQVDQVIIVDMMSDDGSRELYKSMLRQDDKVLDYEPMELFKYGFAHARNFGASAVTTDWILSIDSDEALVESESQSLRSAIIDSNSPVLSVKRLNLIPGEYLSEPDFLTIATKCEFYEEPHRRIYRPTSTIRWEGFIHEEIWSGERSAFFDHQESNLVLWHFSSFRTDQRPQYKGDMYSWMLLHAAANPEKQYGTNENWYKNIVPSQLQSLIISANRFASVKSLPGFDIVDFS